MTENEIGVETEIKLIVGLGNPDSRYKNTRHNIGFDVVEQLAAAARVSWSEAKLAAHARVASLPGGQRLLEPLEYMNNSGRAVREMSDYYRITPAEILVVVDDFSLPMGILRLRASGSAGGHNGLKSIIEHLGSAEFPRLRCGTGPVPPGQDPADFVLGKLSPEDASAARDMIHRACSAVLEALRAGLDKTAGKGLH